MVVLLSEKTEGVEDRRGRIQRSFRQNHRLVLTQMKRGNGRQGKQLS